MAEQYSQTGAGSGSQPPGESFERPAAGTYAGLAVAALLVASAVFILLADRSLRRPPEIPDVLRPDGDRGRRGTNAAGARGDSGDTGADRDRPGDSRRTL